MQRMYIGLDGSQVLIDLTPSEIAEIEAQSIPAKQPRTIDKRRLRVALHRLGLLDNLVYAINQGGIETLMQWEDTTVFSEDSALVQSLIQGLSWSSTTVDSIFTLADTLD